VAIGTGKVGDPGAGAGGAPFIRTRITAKHGKAVADVLRVLYGGSVKPTT